jgi:hypothetical protein
METLHLILIGIGAMMALGLLALLVSLLRQMAWLKPAVGVGLASLALGAVALSLMNQPEVPPATKMHVDIPVPPARLGLSAAATVTLFLLGVIVLLAMACIGAVLGWQWWRERQKQARFRETLRQAQLHALLGEERLSARPSHRLPRSGSVIVIGDRQATSQRGDLPDVVPPEASGWEVIQ